MNLFESTRERVDAALEQWLGVLAHARASDGPEGAHAVPPRLLDAMKYAALSPGKRLRPALVFGGARAVGASWRDVLPPACAVELLHAYSLVHDDLPAMDDDDMRRGRPTLHRAFDEATAILAGDALLTEALGILADGPLLLGAEKQARAKARMRAVVEVSRAAGAAGMVGGQEDDIGLAEKTIDVNASKLRSVHMRKTARLIQASTALGALWVDASPADVRALRQFGADIGLAFQLVDDVLDDDGLARVNGAEATRAEATALTARALEHLGRFGEQGHPLAALAKMMVERTV